MIKDKKYKYLGKILVDSGIISQKDLDLALEEQKRSNIRLGDALEKLGIVSREDIEWALSDQFDLSLVYLKDDMIDLELVKAIPEELARKYHLIPLFKMGNELTVVTDDPTNEETLRKIEELTHLKVKASLGNRSQISNFLDKIYGQEKQRLDLEKKGEVSVRDGEQLSTPDTQAIIDVARQILSSAGKNGSQRIHIYPLGVSYKVSYEKDSQFSEGQELTGKDFGHLLDFIKNKSRSAPGSDNSFLRYYLEFEDHRVWITQDEMFQGISLVMQIQQDLEHLNGILPEALVHDHEGLLSMVRPLFEKNNRLVVIAGESFTSNLALLYYFRQWSKPFNRKSLILEGLPFFHTSDDLQLPYSWWNKDLEWGLEISRRQKAGIVFTDQLGGPEIVRTLCEMVISGLVTVTVSAFSRISEILVYLQHVADPALLPLAAPQLTCLKKIRLICPECGSLRDPLPDERAQVRATLGITDAFKWPQVSAGCGQCNFSGYQGERYLWEWVALNSQEVKELLFSGRQVKDIFQDIKDRVIRPKGLGEFLSGLFLEGKLSFEEINKALLF